MTVLEASFLKSPHFFVSPPFLGMAREEEAFPDQKRQELIDNTTLDRANFLCLSRCAFLNIGVKWINPNWICFQLFLAKECIQTLNFTVQ